VESIAYHATRCLRLSAVHFVPEGVRQLKSQSIEAVLLMATSGSSVDAEAQAKHCSYILYTRLELEHGSGGIFAKLSSALPFRALGGAGSSPTAGAAPAAADAGTAAAPEQVAAAQPTGAAQASVKRGDTVTLDYRLVAVGSENPRRPNRSPARPLPTDKTSWVRWLRK
jgi:hypothetical protein